jgi:hypothetical protein
VNQVGGFYQGLSLLSHLNIKKKAFKNNEEMAR